MSGGGGGAFNYLICIDREQLMNLQNNGAAANSISHWGLVRRYRGNTQKHYRKTSNLRRGLS